MNTLVTHSHFFLYPWAIAFTFFVVIATWAFTVATLVRWVLGQISQWCMMWYVFAAAIKFTFWGGLLLWLLFVYS